MNSSNSVDEKDVSIAQKPHISSNEENIISKITLAGLTVHIVRQNDQIIYKLPDNMQVSSIGEEQRKQLMKEIQTLHSTMAMQQPNQIPSSSTDSAIKPIAPKALSSLDAPPEPTAAETTALEETARSLREELERQQKMQQQMYNYNSSNDNKTTRKYNKTGKYSKKRQIQLQQQMQQQIQQKMQQPSYQQFIQHLQQGSPQQQLQQNVSFDAPLSLNSVATPTSNTGSTPFPLAPLAQRTVQESDKSMTTVSTPLSQIATIQQTTAQPTMQQKAPQPSTQVPADSILSKRLPEEEMQHREVKRRIMESLLSDRNAVVSVNYKEPFSSVEDAINRLLPYHIYQYPKRDLDSNQIPLERQDNTMIEIFKCQSEMFEKHNQITTKNDTNHQNTELKTLINRQIVADQRQKAAQEQTRIDAEQTAQREEALRVQAEKARLAAVTEQQNFQQVYPNLQPQVQMQQIVQQLLPKNTLDQVQQNPGVNYPNGFAQASALLQNSQFINHYSQLSPDLQQRLVQNREQLMALIEKQQLNNFNNGQQK